MSAKYPSIDNQLATLLVGLLAGHGVEATQRDELVLVENNESQWVRLTVTKCGEASIQMQVMAAGPGGLIVSDSWAGLGNEMNIAVKDAVHYFCVGDFHVLLAALWGLLEEDQVDYHVVATENGRWDLYLGGWVSRRSDPQSSTQPWAAFTKALLDAAPVLLRQRRVRTGRVFVAIVNGDTTYEALLDEQPSGELDAVIRSVPLTPSVSGYESHRLFFLAIPRDGEDAHRRVRKCVGT